MSEENRVNGRKKSKSQLKREMNELQELGETLLYLNHEQLHRLSDQDLIDAVVTARKIKKNSARNRQLQLIGKLMRHTDVIKVIELVNQSTHQSRLSAQHFHKVERWRAGLIAHDEAVMQEIILECPLTDRQHLNQLVRLATNETESHTGSNRHSRKLFRFLRQLTEKSGANQESFD